MDQPKLLSYAKVSQARMLLKVSYGLLFLIAGLDKFLNLIVDWGKYVSPIVLKMFNTDNYMILIVVGVIEILLGFLVLTKWTRIGAYGIAIWFLIIVINLLSMWSYLDIAARDVVLAMGAVALAWLSEKAR